MKALSLQEILEAFDPIDRPLVVLPELAGFIWEEHDFLGWREPGGGKGFMVVQLPERNVGMVLTMTASPQSGICDLCRGIDRTDGAAMVTTECWERPRSKFGIHVCSSLDCSDSVRGIKWVYRMGETIPTGRRIERLQENVERFARGVTGLRKQA